VNKRYIVRLTAEERASLGTLISKSKCNARKLVHAHILLKVDVDGPKWGDEQACEAFGVHTNTVAAIRERFVMEGLESALNRKKQCRPSRERKIDGATEARLIATACGSPPEGRARWTLRLLANRLVELKVFESISHETVRRALFKTS
jgi:hypothetical protein